MKDSNQLKPEHYHKHDIDVITFLALFFGNNKIFTVLEGFFIGNVIKYVCRYKYKNGLEDLKKARDYLERLIETYEEPK